MNLPSSSSFVFEVAPSALSACVLTRAAFFLSHVHARGEQASLARQLARPLKLAMICRWLHAA